MKEAFPYIKLFHISSNFKSNIAFIDAFIDVVTLLSNFIFFFDKFVLLLPPADILKEKINWMISERERERERVMC